MWCVQAFIFFPLGILICSTSSTTIKVPSILRALARYPVEQHKMGADICSLAQAPVFRRRMTYVLLALCYLP